MACIRSAVAAASLLAIAGCGVVAKVDARQDMRQSKAAYKACLTANASNPAVCESARLTYEADVQAYRTLSAGIQPGRNDTFNVNTSGQ